MAQGPPKPNPKPKQAEGRKLPKNTKRNGISVARWGSALAKYQLLSTELLFLRHSKAEWLWKSREIRGVCVGLERPRVCPRHQNEEILSCLRKLLWTTIQSYRRHRSSQGVFYEQVTSKDPTHPISR